MYDLLQSMEARGDQRAAFLHCYSLMSRNMVSALEAGRFHDRDWMRRFIDHFAEYYFNALDGYERDKSAAPPVWVLAHDTALHSSCSLMQKLLLGVNAHINFDLALTVTDLLDEAWPKLSPAERQRHIEDYQLVNEIIGNSIDEVQDHVLAPHSPSMAHLDRLMGRVDEWLISGLITSWRREVWGQACQLLDAPRPADREHLRAQLEAKTVKRGEAILFRKGWRSLRYIWRR